jgi:hypothetical protein
MKMYKKTGPLNGGTILAGRPIPYSRAMFRFYGVNNLVQYVHPDAVPYFTVIAVTAKMGRRGVAA